MGQYLNIYRLPPEWAVEMLSGRQGVGDLKEGNAASPIYIFQSSRQNGTGTPQRALSLDRIDIQFPSDTLDWKRHQLYVGRHYRPVADMLTGYFHGLHQRDSTFEVALDETDEPLDWAVFGRRICGWRIDLPLRYNAPTDLLAITDALAALTDEDLRSNIHRVAGNHPHDPQQCPMGYLPEAADDRLNDFLPHLLTNLGEFFQRAEKAGEFVVHQIG